MKIITNSNHLGFRELQRLIGFIDLMMKNYSQDCIEAIFDYDLYNDEPNLYHEVDCTTFYASDYDIAFDCSNNAIFI